MHRLAPVTHDTIKEISTMRLHRYSLATLALMTAALVAAEPYGDISDLKLQKPEDKQDFKSTPPPRGAIVLFDGKSLDNWVKARAKQPEKTEWKLVDGGA